MILGIHIQGPNNQIQLYLSFKDKIKSMGRTANPHKIVTIGTYKVINPISKDRIGSDQIIETYAKKMIITRKIKQKQEQEQEK